MKSGAMIDAFLLSNPFHRGMVEWLILVGTGICGLMFSWTKFSIFPISNMLGGLLILSAFAFHCWAHMEHKQAHKRSEDIDTLVTSGVYAKIRHPLYFSLIFLNIGIALSFGVMITFILALLTIVHWIATSIKEEEILLQRFPDAYRQYKLAVRWRMIPGIF